MRIHEDAHDIIYILLLCSLQKEYLHGIFSSA